MTPRTVEKRSPLVSQLVGQLCSPSQDSLHGGMCIGGEHWRHETTPCDLLINSATSPRLNRPRPPHRVAPHRDRDRRRSHFHFHFRSRLLVEAEGERGGEGEGGVEVEIQHLPFELPSRVAAPKPRRCQRRYLSRDQQANSTATTPLLRTPPAFLNQVINHLPLEPLEDHLRVCRRVMSVPFP